MPGRDAGGGESRVKTFCKNLFHKRCCSPRGRERLRSLWCRSRLARGGQERAAFPPSQPLSFVQSPKTVVGAISSTGLQGQGWGWRNDLGRRPLSGGRKCCLMHCPSPIFTGIILAVVAGSIYLTNKAIICGAGTLTLLAI